MNTNVFAKIVTSDDTSFLSSCAENQDLDVAGAVLLNSSSTSTIVDTAVRNITEHICGNNNDSGSKHVTSLQYAVHHKNSGLDTLKYLGNFPYTTLAVSLVNERRTPPEVLRKIFYREKHLRDVIVGNPNTPDDVLTIMVDENDYRTVERICYNPSLSDDLAEKILGLDEPSYNMILANKSCSDKILRQLSTDVSHLVRNVVAGNDATTADVLADMFFGNDSASLRKKICEHASCPEHIRNLHDLAI